MRTRLEIGVLAILAVAILLAVPAASSPARPDVPGSPLPPSSPASESGAQLLANAQASLQPHPLSTSTPAGWTNLTPTVGPGARTHANLVFDVAIGAVVLFGGRAATFLNDTWTYSAGHWTQWHGARGPSPRDAAAMAYDDATGAVLLFGGFNGAYLSDTWSFAQGNWTRLHPATSPSIRADAGIAFDPKTGSVILFGGASPALRNDTWQFFGGTWTSIASARAPSPRSDTTLVEDPEAGGVVLFGGAGTHPLNDTWLMQAGSWSNLSSTIAPSPRAGAAASFDSVDGYVVLFGGATGPAANQTWEFRAHSWTELFPPHTPAARSFAGGAFDPVDGVSLLFGGGWTGTSFSDLWGYRAAPTTFAWLNVSTGTAPAARTQAAFAYDPADGYVLLFGGENHQANNASVPFFHDTWSYRGGVWTKLAVGTSPSARRGAMMEYDPHLGAMVLFGGSNTTSYLNDTWKFRGGTWTHLVTSVAPAPRRSGSFAWDPSTATMVLYGGHNGTGGGLNGWYGIYSDTWEYRSTGWARVTGSPSPEPRAEALLAYDPTEAQLVLFGGYEQNHSHPWEEELNSTWTFHDGRWANLTAAIGGRAPLHRDGAGFVYDPAAGALYLFGGDDNTPNPINTTWTFAFDRWTEVCNCHATLWTADHAAYDAADGYIVTPAGHAALLSTVIFAPQSFVAASAMPNPVDANRTTVLTAWSGGGSGPLALAWNLGSGRVASGSEVATMYSTPGPHAVTVWANGSGVGSVAATFTVVVNMTLSAGLQVTPKHVSLGAPISGNASYSGGTGSYTWSFSGMPPGCPAPTALSFSCTPSSTGNFTIVFRIVDASGANATASAAITVS